jgi:hypothetical protein
MIKISTGEDSTLGTYLKIAAKFGKHAEQYMLDQIALSAEGIHDEVFVDEKTMLWKLNFLESTKYIPIWDKAVNQCICAEMTREYEAKITRNLGGLK